MLLVKDSMTREVVVLSPQATAGEARAVRPGGGGIRHQPLPQGTFTTADGGVDIVPSCREIGCGLDGDSDGNGHRAGSDSPRQDHSTGATAVKVKMQ